MSRFKIHPIVMGTKNFDKGMMTYQHEYGKKYTIPIYCWYIEGRNKRDPVVSRHTVNDYFNK